LQQPWFPRDSHEEVNRAVWYESLIIGGLILGAASVFALHFRRVLRGGTRCGCGKETCSGRYRYLSRPATRPPALPHHTGTRRAAAVCQIRGGETTLRLSDCRPGQVVTVTHVEGNGRLVQRLMEMGVVTGAKVRVVRFAPLGDPMAVEIHDSFLSLRKSEANVVEVEP
jgi:ferrous iron transport protein A